MVFYLMSNVNCVSGELRFAQFIKWRVRIRLENGNAHLLSRHPSMY